MKIELLGQINTPSGDKPSEDCVGYNLERGSFWVIDGATDLYPEERFFPSEPSDAHWYALALNAVFTQAAEAGRDDGGLDFFKRIVGKVREGFIEATREKPQHLSGFRPSKLPSAAAIWVKTEGSRLLTVRAADCEAHLLTDGGALLSNSDWATKRREILKGDGIVRAAERGHATGRLPPLDDPGVLAILRNRRDEVVCENFSLFKNVADRLVCKTFQIHGSTSATLLLASDGFLRLVDVFEAYTHEGLIRAAMPQEKGLAGLVEELRDWERNAIATGDTRQVKGHDDASALLLRIEP